MELQNETPRPRKSGWWPLLGAVLLSLPGALTFSFALGEARRFDSDWVYISTPLLVLGAACLVLALARWFGKVGLLVGALGALAGFGAAYKQLAGEIEARQEHARRYAEYRKLERFCAGDTAADERAREYAPGKPGPAPTVVYTRKGYRSAKWQASYKPLFAAWDPSKPYLAETALVACIEEKRLPPLQICHYQGGRTLERLRTDLLIRLYAVHSGALVFETRLEGGPPRACKGLEEFYGEYKGGVIYGDIPSLQQAAEVLRPHVEIH